MADAALLVLLVLLAFSSTLPNGWIWDDDDYVTANPTLASTSGLRAIWLDRRATPQYYPLVHTSFWIERRVWGTEPDETGRPVPRPFGYHLDNVLLHALGAIVLWRLLRRLRLPAAWFGAALFALHPVTVESVAWVTERKNVLSLLLALGAAAAYLGWAREGRARSLVLSGVLFLGALLSKTVVASLPAVLLLLLWWRRERLDARTVAPLVVMLVAGGWLGWRTAVDEQLHVGATGAAWDFTFVERCLIASRALWFYAGKLLWPVGLVFIYPRWEIDASAAWQYAFPAAAAALVASLLVLSKRIGRGPLVTVLIFAGVLFPALGFFNVYPHLYSFVADHFQHHAAVAVLAALAALLARLWPFRLATGGMLEGPFGARQPLAALVAWGVLLAVLAVLTWRQGEVYRDSEALWRHVIERNPTASMAYNNLAVLEQERGNPDRALAYFERSLEEQPDNVNALNNLGTLYAQEGRLDLAEPLLVRAIELAPSYVKAHVTLGHLYYRTGDHDRSILHFRKANAARRYGPDPQIQVYLGQLLARRGRIEEAVSEYRAVLVARGAWVDAALGLIWLRATHPDAAVRDATEATALAERLRRSRRSGEPAVLDAIAAALAEAARFEEAVQAAREAAARARRAGSPDLASAIDQRAELYRQGRPFRTPGGYLD